MLAAGAYPKHPEWFEQARRTSYIQLQRAWLNRHEWMQLGSWDSKCKAVWLLPVVTAE